MKMKSPDKKTLQRATIIYDRLIKRYPNPEPELDWNNAWELMVATALAAQCTDVRVNKVTPELFKRWPGPAEMIKADIADIEEVIRSTGLFRNKAKNLKGAAEVVMNEFGGEMPRTMKDMIKLPGVARKTANIVLSNAMDIHEGVAVDTHVKRLSFRMGLTESTNPNVIEKDLMPLFKRENWGDANHVLVLYGREICSARSPKCDICELNDICPKNGIEKK
ncbi:endonuclease III [Maridesulfovibrio salexigens]|uniref:Endonuclease III n=1 Tax=Maridesulfovibrio salexigens (strain ATCC 14822 / DSM 2638 / NCIMB 8403 / VKM B-1763) TaxID=526222 RepID=C6BY30_MARSD|nr:endonuclease III [Maridesulfovibrio salexigens]ACS80560.1 endonuclease III [Maridesulfovibrio salexigens DSM 2638]